MSPAEKSRPRGWLAVAGSGVAVLLLAIGLQYWQGAYGSDFGGHPDEAAHVVTTLMVRDYLAEGLWRGEHPMRFAKDYYEQFPKVALGHYPPAFYLAAGTAMLPFRSPMAMLVISALLTTVAALLSGGAAARLSGRWLPGLVVAVVFCFMPLVRSYTAIVMSDMLLVVFSLLAMLCLSRFLSAPQAKWSLLFGVCATAAILTKGSGLFLALTVPLALALSGRLKMVTNWRLWLAPVPVLVFALPWMLYTAKITQEGMIRTTIPEYIANAAPYFAGQWPRVFGWVLTVLFVVAIGDRVRALFSRGASLPDTDRSSWAALALGVFFFCLLVPSGFEGRYFLPAVAPVLILGFDIATRLVGGLLEQHGGRAKDLQDPSRAPTTAAVIVSLVVGIAIVAERHEVSRKSFTGASESIEFLLESHGADGEDGERVIVLVVSDAPGEGAVTAAAAFADPARLYVRRGSKELASLDWMGRDYASRFGSEAELAAYLHDSEIDAVIIDKGVPADKRLPYHDQSEAALTGAGSGFQLTRSMVAQRNEKTKTTLEVWTRLEDASEAAVDL